MKKYLVVPAGAEFSTRITATRGSIVSDGSGRLQSPDGWNWVVKFPEKDPITLDPGEVEDLFFMLRALYDSQDGYAMPDEFVRLSKDLLKNGGPK